ncbi:MAG: SDR family NAD(P)-dependent oxidoreductase [Beijerinckiaceae bacterium]
MNKQMPASQFEKTPLLLDNKVCMIVGAASLRGIGFAAAQLFAQHGAKIIVVDIAMDEAAATTIRAAIQSSTGTIPDVVGIQCDIRQSLACDHAVAHAVRTFGTLDCLINCAGIVRAQPMLTIEEADYDLIMDVNLKGTFNICKSALAVFKENQSGSIVNLASVAAQRGGGLVGGAHYAASKGGVVSLTRTIAREFGAHGIRANTICPSMIETSMLDGNLSAEKFNEIVAAVPLQRAGLPIDVAGACLFLASDLSAYITGATLDVNGGSHIH